MTRSEPTPTRSQVGVSDTLARRQSPRADCIPSAYAADPLRRLTQDGEPQAVGVASARWRKGSHTVPSSRGVHAAREGSQKVTLRRRGTRRCAVRCSVGSMTWPAASGNLRGDSRWDWRRPVRVNTPHHIQGQPRTPQIGVLARGTSQPDGAALSCPPRVKAHRVSRGRRSNPADDA